MANVFTVESSEWEESIHSWRQASEDDSTASEVIATPEGITCPGVGIAGGIGMIHRDFGTYNVSVKIHWTGYPSSLHFEATPVLHVDPASPLHAFGAWPATVVGDSDAVRPFWLIGYLSNPVTAFSVTHIATPQPDDHHDGEDVDIELVSNGTSARLFFRDVPQEVTPYPGGGAPVLDIPIHPSLHYITRHGVALDHHIEPEENRANDVTVTRFEISSSDPLRVGDRFVQASGSGGILRAVGGLDTNLNLPIDTLRSLENTGVGNT